MVFLNDPGLMGVLTKVYDTVGVDFSHYKENMLLRRIKTRLRWHEASCYEDYITILNQQPEELDALIDSLTINGTELFRNGESFRIIANKVIPELVSLKMKKSHRVIKVWSCGCSGGDEPFSLAMLILDQFADLKTVIKLSVIGTDVDHRVMDSAQDITYKKKDLKAVPADFVTKYFIKNYDGYTLSPEVKKFVFFKRHDVIEDPPIKYCDIILCRNLLTCFTKELQKEILLKFYECLNPGGLLVLGMSESLTGTALNHFEHIDNRQRVYRKPESDSMVVTTGAKLGQEDIDQLVKDILGR